MKILLLSLLALTTLKAWAFDLQAFRRTVSIDQRVQAEMRKFSHNGTALPNAYVNQFVTSVMNRAFGDKAQFLAGNLAERPCRTTTRVDFYSPGGLFNHGQAFSGAAKAAIDEFESGALRIEAIGCLEGPVSRAALVESMRDEFQLSVVDELRSSRQSGGLTCQETYVFGLGTSEFCFSSTTRFASDESYLLTQNLTNAPVSRAGAPVFYRTMILSFHEAGGRTYSHMVAYVRGAKIPSAVRGIARRQIGNTQRETYQALQRNL